jgi:hypothetical protein
LARPPRRGSSWRWFFLAGSTSSHRTILLVLLTSATLTISPLTAQPLRDVEPRALEDLLLLDRTPPSPSRLEVSGRWSAESAFLQLTIEHRGERPPGDLLVYAEPSHRLLLVEWEAPPSIERRALIEKDSPLAVRSGGKARLELAIPFAPEEDTGILVQVLTRDGSRRTLLAGRVRSLRDFSVAADVFSARD